MIGRFGLPVFINVIDRPFADIAYAGLFAAARERLLHIRKAFEPQRV
jgi:hypothetical protein